MNYKPYSMEWSRHRYLAEAIQQYFNTDATVDVILGDIVDVLETNIDMHKNSAEKLQQLLDALK